MYFNCFLLCKTNRFHVAVRLFSIIDHRGRQNVVRASVTHSAAPRVPPFCSYILTSSVIYYWTDARQHGIYLLNGRTLMTQRTIRRHSLLPQSHNAVRFGGSLRKNNTSCLLLGLYHASVNWISISTCVARASITRRIQANYEPIVNLSFIF